MKKLTLTIIVITLLYNFLISQELTQTVRGTIKDADSKTPLIGATVAIINSNPVIGVTTDIDGNFRLDKVPVGRVSLLVSYLGYESKTAANIAVNSGKESILNITLQESVINIDEVVVKPKRKNGEPLNEMAIISARSVSAEQTNRYAGGFDDPSRLLSNFAGVTSTQDGSNDIIVRGNSPKYIQWRLEGVEITNPNHFEDQNSSSGGISALNNRLLATSDFYTGAFSPEYGDVLSGVYDVKLRTGNNEKFESMFGFGILGTDFTIEGPFKKGYGGSYLVNYRYSTVSIIQDLGLVDLDGVLRFQDFTAKVVLPTKNFGNFSMFTLSGLNSFDIKDIKADGWKTPGDKGMRPDVVEDFEKANYLSNSGISHTLPLNKKSFIKTTFVYSTDGIKDDIYQSSIIDTIDTQGNAIKDTINRALGYKSRIRKSSYRTAITYSNKINAKNRIQIGSKYTLQQSVNNQQRMLNTKLPPDSIVNFDGGIATLRNFVSWKHRLNDKLTFVAGIHNMNVLYNNKSTIEPRIAANIKLNNTSSIHFGYGNHSNMERLHNYFARVKNEDSIYVEPNKDLDLLKAHHFVLGYKHFFTENLVANVEFYYQHLYNLPVENLDTSYYATINEGLEYRYVDLVNEGVGKNYGVELTLERYFANNYYYLINTSLYQSKYKSLEGKWRNTMYNGEYLVNFLCGKEFENLGKKQNKTLAINGKAFFGGGQKVIPLLRDANGNLAVEPEKEKFWDYSKAYEDKIEDTYQITISASLKINKPKATHEIFLNLDNITNNKGRITEHYDADEPNSIGYMTQFGFFPNLMYRVYF